MVSSCLGGSVYLWNSKKRIIVNTIDKSQLNIETWAEDLCWVTPDTLAVSVAHKDGNHSQSQMLLMNMKDDMEYNTTSQSLAPRPHLKGVSAMGSIKYNEDSDGLVSSMFVTGGNDHGLMLWEVNKAAGTSQYQHPSVTPINSRHSSKVLSLHYHDLSQTLYSGGADGKLTWYNLALGNSGSEFKIGERINHILSNPVNPHLLMLCMATRTNQFRLYDLRAPQDSGLDLMFGCTEPDNVSRYLRPDWKPDSWTVASGNMQDHKIHIWDLRYKDVAKGGPSYSWDGHSNKVLRTLFIPGNTMVSVGTDKNTVFTDYQLQTNGKVSTRT
ncbi:WD40-repeat-containing domain protein [Umbelopsis sp. AD052]|nr:WD40-repeat-containing domain protein [Umbelopsis sp. AD052]